MIHFLDRLNYIGEVMFQKLKCLFGFHEPEIAVTQFTDGLFSGRFDGEHKMYSFTICKHCRARTEMHTILSVKDDYNILIRKQLSNDKTIEVKQHLQETTKSIKEISALTQVSQTTVRRILKSLKENMK